GRSRAGRTCGGRGRRSDERRGRRAGTGARLGPPSGRPIGRGRLPLVWTSPGRRLRAGPAPSGRGAGPIRGGGEGAHRPTEDAVEGRVRRCKGGRTADEGVQEGPGAL